MFGRLFQARVEEFVKRDGTMLLKVNVKIRLGHSRN